MSEWWHLNVSEDKTEEDKQKTNQTWAEKYQMHSFFLLLVQYIQKKSFEVKIIASKQHQYTSFFYNYKKLLTSKCTIRLNVNSTHWRGTEIKERS